MKETMNEFLEIVAHPLRALRVAFGEVPSELRSTVHFFGRWRQTQSERTRL